MREDSNNLSMMLENGLDMILNMLAFLGSYVVMMLIGYEPTVSLESAKTMTMLFISVIASSFVYQLFHLNKPIPYINVRYSLSKILLANITYFGLSSFFTWLVAAHDKKEFLIIWTIIAAFASTLLLLFKKRVIIYLVRLSRKHRDIVKKVIIIGDNRESARSFVKEVINDKHSGIMLIGGVGRKMGVDTGCEKLGDFEDLREVLEKCRPDYAVFAVDSYESQQLVDMVNTCDDHCVKVYFLPVIYGFFKSSKQVERVGTIPIINIHSTPLDNSVNRFMKRMVDVVGALLLIILTSPVMLAAVIGVRISSPGPILFKQVRVGYMGKKFWMLKFRSMRVNSDSKVAWTTGNDPRKTRFGTFIRKTAIDELPQLFNVLKGEMSLVGPRPEIPYYVDYFRNRIPLYMIKHYVKPGITGLAQINGLRGDTSIDDRIHADITYLEHWSMGLDLYILLKTPFKAINKNEKYNDSKDDNNTEITTFQEQSHTTTQITIDEIYTSEAEKSDNTEFDENNPSL